MVFNRLPLTFAIPRDAVHTNEYHDNTILLCKNDLHDLGDFMFSIVLTYSFRL
jgi:hypothetical protein